MGDVPELDRLIRFLGEFDTAAVRDGSVGNYAGSLKTVPVMVSVAGATLRISTSLYRDFMPACPPGGRPLIAGVTVVADPPSVVPPLTRATRLAVVHGPMIWTSPVAEDQGRMRDPSQFTVVARGGPKWGPGIVVDVVLEVRDRDRRPYLVRAADQPIGRTD
ncbi:hypothetical protein ODJ79_27425 [Actinoplanes sp. KI2]|uniref:hypothetical protein n=1 Tax=Actinoplanes sp. KI2 TaxID=2983315 RepID=UPI0021D5D84C|nr:hypothetical protein [Actinoplanes sp. KI2]MCU7727480.1 hypothetical protein [Actinoplanes sp. KI2]